MLNASSPDARRSHGRAPRASVCALAALALLAACGGGDGGGGGGGPTGPTTVLSIAAVGATALSGAPGYALDDSIAVRVTDGSGQAVAGTAVRFQVSGG